MFNKIISYSLITFGLFVFFSGGIYKGCSNYYWQKEKVSVTGEVISLKKVPIRNRHVSEAWVPKIRFRTAMGEIVEVYAFAARYHRSQLEIGQKIAIYYSPKNPKFVVINQNNLVLGPLLALAFGLLFFAVGMGVRR